MTDLILYYAPTACSIAPHIALEEAELAFEPRLIDLGKDEQTSPEFLRINPVGRVPVLVADGRVITEVPALLTYIASLRPAANLVPPEGSLEFARCFEWLAFLSSTLHVTYAQFRRPARFLSPGSDCWHELTAEGRERTIDLYREVDRRLGDAGGWAAGNRYSIADMYLFPFFTWAWRLEFDVRGECPAWADLFDRSKARPAVQRAVAREGLTV